MPCSPILRVHTTEYSVLTSIAVRDLHLMSCIGCGNLFGGLIWPKWASTKALTAHRSSWLKAIVCNTSGRIQLRGVVEKRLPADCLANGTIHPTIHPSHQRKHPKGQCPKLGVPIPKDLHPWHTAITQVRTFQDT